MYPRCVTEQPAGLPTSHLRLLGRQCYRDQSGPPTFCSGNQPSVPSAVGYSQAPLCLLLTDFSIFKQNIKRKLSLKMREYLCCFPFFLPVILLFPLSQDLCVCTCNSVPMLLAPALYSADCFSCFTSQLKCLFLEKVPIYSICSRPPLHVKALLERKNPCLFCSLIYP